MKQNLCFLATGMLLSFDEEGGDTFNPKNTFLRVSIMMPLPCLCECFFFCGGIGSLVKGDEILKEEQYI